MIAHGTGEGKNLTIKAQNAGGINKSGGNLILSGGLLTANTGGNATTSTNGKVVIGSSLKLNSLNGPASGSAPLQVNASGDVSVGSYYSDTNLSNLATGTSIAFENPTDADGGDLNIKAQNGNGSNKSGKNSTPPIDCRQEAQDNRPGGIILVHTRDVVHTLSLPCE